MKEQPAQSELQFEKASDLVRAEPMTVPTFACAYPMWVPSPAKMGDKPLQKFVKGEPAAVGYLPRKLHARRATAPEPMKVSIEEATDEFWNPKPWTKKKPKP